MCLLLGQSDTLRNPRTDGPSRHLTIVGFKLGKNTLADVQARLGKASIRQCSRDEEASKELCYSGKDGTRIAFKAGFSGGWSELDAYRVIARDAGSSCYSTCARTDQMIAANVETSGGLRLGISRQLLLTRLGPPKTTKGSELVFQWHSRQPMTKEQAEGAGKTFKTPVTDPSYDVQDTIKVELRHSKVAEFEVEHLVTY